MNEIEVVSEVVLENPIAGESTTNLAPKLETRIESGWAIIPVKSRVDSFNQMELVDEIKSIVSSGQNKIALNLRNNRFLNFTAIRFCVDLAREINSNGGTLAIIGASEKVKKHFEVYGSLDAILIARTETDLF